MKWFAEQEEINKHNSVTFVEGRILYKVSGYDQTNVHFAVVEKATAKSVLLRSIGQCLLQPTIKGMTGHVVPNIQDISEHTFRKIPKFSHNIKEWYLSGDSSWSGNWYVYDKGNEGVWSSWYA